MGAALSSDPTLLTELRRYGKFDSAACYQCGTCTISCALVTDFATFPRRLIRYGLLGLRQPLIHSLEPWICHDCGDCSIVCPRQADPRMSMMTLRRFLKAQYDWTGISSRILRSRAWYLGSLLAGAAIALGLILWYHLSFKGMPLRDFATIPLGLEHMFPTMTYYTLTVILLPPVFLFAHVFRMWWLTMHAGGQPRAPWSAYVTEAWRYVYHSATHTLMRKCPERGRWLGHWVMAFGVTLMLAIKIFGLQWFQTDAIYPLYHPQRWLGYLAALCIAYGIASIAACRVRARKEFCRETTFEDLVFPILLLLTALSGLAVHVFRYVGMGLTSHFAYALHIIIATPMLVVEMSLGKWSHMVYRPMALYFQAVRERAVQRAPAEEALPHAA